MMFSETPTVVQRSPLLHRRDSIITRVTARCAVLRCQDAHLVVHQMQVGSRLGEDRDQGLAQSDVEGVHRAVAVGHLIARDWPATFEIITVASDSVTSSPLAHSNAARPSPESGSIVEIVGDPAQGSSGQKLEGGLGPVVGDSPRTPARFTSATSFSTSGVVAFDFDADLLRCRARMLERARTGPRPRCGGDCRPARGSMCS